MKFSILPLPTGAEIDYTLRVGNVYPRRQGRSGGIPGYWIVACLNGHGCHMWGVNHDGEITSIQCYGRFVFDGSMPKLWDRGRGLIGTCPALAVLNLKVFVKEA